MFLIQFDACKRDKLGLASIGYVLYYNSTVLYKHYSLINHNIEDSNCAEYTALINALKFANNLCIEDLYIEGDAKIVIDQVNNICNINCERVKPLHKEVSKLKNRFKTISFEHIYRKKNIFADSLANHALKEFQESIF
jgi:ribonuclease HI